MTQPLPTIESGSSDYDVLQQLQTIDQEEKLYAWAKLQYEQIRQMRNSVERQWYLNLSFYFGRQYVTTVNTSASPTGFRLVTPKAPPWRVRLVTNKIRPTIRKELAKLTSSKPTVTVMPATSDDADLVAAQVGEMLIEDMYRRKVLEDVLRRAVFWTQICGTGFIKEWWNDHAKDSVTGAVGDIDVEEVPPFNLFVPDLLQEDIEKQPFVIHAMCKSPEWVVSAYGEDKVKGLNPMTVAANDILQSSFLSIIGATQPRANSVFVMEVWVKPGGHSYFPNGGMFTCVGDRVVHVEKNYPYKHGEYPFSKLEHIPSGKFYSDSTIEDLIPLQREFNRSRSQIIEAKNRMAKPQLLAPAGSIDANKILSEPGAVIFYELGYNKPEPMPLVPLPEYVMQNMQEIQNDMDDISGQHEVSRGGATGQVSSATALSFLSEQDDTMLSHTVSKIERAVEKLGRHYLQYVSQYWTTKRIVRVVGEDGSFDAREYKASDLSGNHDVRVDAGSALPQSRAAKQAFVMDLAKLGLIPPDKVLEILDIGGLERVYNDLQIDLKQIRRENLRMLEGTQISINTWDNHQMHIQIHNQFRKTQQFESLDTEEKQMWEAHVQGHMQAMQMAMMQAQQMQPGQPQSSNGLPQGGQAQLSLVQGGGQPDQSGQGGQNPQASSQVPTLGTVPVNNG